MRASLYPLQFKPVYQAYLWGGDRIIRTYRRAEPAGIYAESWEISDRPEGMSVVRNGPLAGQSLGQLVARFGPKLVGAGHPAAGPGKFPLLIKLIDSRERLSVQVHPDDETARRFGGEAKTEMWYILDADAGARVFAGFRPGVDAGLFREAIQNKTFERVLNPVPVARGDAVFMPGGRVHAIDAGCLILEIQQNSNTTYRIYDWGRVGADGLPRELHLEEAQRVVRWDDPRPPKVQPRKLGYLGANELWEILTSPYFRLERLVLSEEWPCACDGRTFHALFIPSGAVSLSWDEDSDVLSAGTSCLVPAGLSGYRLTPVEPGSQVLRITVP